MKKKLLATLGIFAVITISLLCRSLIAQAAFNANNVMDDGVFDNVSTMNASQIDAWLNTYFPNSCISTNNGFSAPEPTGYRPSTGFTYVGTASAGNIIYDAARVYNLNPQVILATLEKESSVVSGNASYHCQYINTAMGYDCRDNSACPANPATESGFSQQVIHATWMLKFHEQRSKGNVGWDVQVTNFPHAGDVWDNSDDPQSCYSGRMTQGTYAICPSGAGAPYDGLTTIDNSTVHLDTAATAALYDYTPHFHGNQLFDDIFVSWFGAIYAAPYTAIYSSQSAYPNLRPGQQASVYITYENLGSATWYDNQGIGSAPSGTYPVHLATANPLNRSSVFSSTWATPSRPTVNFAAVYYADGVTLTPNQHVAQPGQIVKFSFTMTAPMNQLAGSFTEYFQPVLEGSPSQSFNNPGTSLTVTVPPIQTVSYVSESTYPTIAPSNSQAAYVMFSNTGNTPMYDSQSIGSAPAGNFPVHLAVSCPLNTTSSFMGSDWATTSRPAVNFAAVYNADGVTLASNQHMAFPGQIVKFAFHIAVPTAYTAGTYKLCLQPVLEGTSDGYYPDTGVFLNITVPSMPVISYTNQSLNYNIVSGEQGNFSMQINNVGNLALASGSKLVSNNASGYYDTSWVSPTAITTLTSSLAPGSSTTLTFKLLAPVTSSAQNNTFNITVNDPSNNTVQNSPQTVSIHVAAPYYSASYAGQSAYPSLSYGQAKDVFLEYKNTGNKPWYDDSSVGSATTRNPLPTHLATDSPLNVTSGFAYNWPISNRPAVTFSTVYEADGSTLASDQHVVQPGQIAKFSFQMAPLTGTSPGSYRQYFRPIIEGTPDGAIGFQWTYFDVTVVAPKYIATYYGQSPYLTLAAGQSGSVFLEYKNTGNIPWYEDGSLASSPLKGNLLPVHLGTAHPLNRASVFGSNWPTTSRPAVTFSTVYEADGSTLASDQHVVQPGQIAKFVFSLAVPPGYPTGTYREYFQPLAEGSPTGLFNDPWTSLVITTTP